MSKQMSHYLAFFMVCAVAMVFQLRAASESQHGPLQGYEDTPLLPGTSWHVHDAQRPQPVRIKPGTCSTPTKPGQPPSDAVVLFDGKDLSKWQTEKGGAAAWKVANGYVEATPKAGDIYTRDQFGDIQLHVEWATPPQPKGQPLSYGNSGVFLYGVFELQVFESSVDLIYADGQAGAMYGQYPPLVNVSLKPGEWQIFDVLFSPPRFNGGQLLSPAYVTVLQNGVVIHNHAPLMGETGHRTLPPYVDRGPRGPIRLQDHGDRVRYRNIWVRPLKGYDER